MIINFQNYFFRQDIDNATDKSLAVAVSLATVLNRTFQARSQAATSLIEKCPQFLSKEKKQKIFAKVSSKIPKKVEKQRHNFELKQYYQIKYCNHSKELIWGVAPQGYQCTCKFYIRISSKLKSIYFKFETEISNLQKNPQFCRLLISISNLK